MTAQLMSQRAGHRSRPSTPFPIVERESLLERLTVAVSEVALTLVSAPAGYGKTVLVSDWVGRRDPRRSAAWLTLTQRDDDPGVFWRHVRLALAVTGTLAVEPLRPTGAADVDVLAEQLLQVAVPVVLVLDAVDRLRDRLVFEQLAGLLDQAGDR